jgi:hypothetical protein
MCFLSSSILSWVSLTSVWLSDWVIGSTLIRTKLLLNLSLKEYTSVSDHFFTLRRM